MSETQTNTGADKDADPRPTPTPPIRLPSPAKFVGRKQSDSIGKLANALVRAQKEVKAAELTRENSHFGNSYATLASVVDACKDALNKNGISFIQIPADAPDGKLGLETILLHDSGEWISGTGIFALGRGDGPQSYGSAMTYARRYFLAGMVGVCPEDDDGEGAEGRQDSSEPRPGRQQIGPARGAGNNSKAADL